VKRLVVALFLVAIFIFGIASPSVFGHELIDWCERSGTNIAYGETWTNPGNIWDDDKATFGSHTGTSGATRLIYCRDSGDDYLVRVSSVMVCVTSTGWLNTESPAQFQLHYWDGSAFVLAGLTQNYTWASSQCKTALNTVPSVVSYRWRLSLIGTGGSTTMKVAEVKMYYEDGTPTPSLTPTTIPSSTPYPTNTPYETYTPYPTFTPENTYTLYPTNTPYETYTPYPTNTPGGLTNTPMFTDTPTITFTPSASPSPIVMTNTYPWITSVCVAESLTNGDFESGLTGWITDGAVSLVPSEYYGGSAARLGFGASLSQSFDVAPSTVDYIGLQFAVNSTDVAWLTLDWEGCPSVPVSFGVSGYWSGYQTVRAPCEGAGDTVTITFENLGSSALDVDKVQLVCPDLASTEVGPQEVEIVAQAPWAFSSVDLASLIQGSLIGAVLVGLVLIMVLRRRSV
jgi:hypothetical protein